MRAPILPFPVAILLLFATPSAPAARMSPLDAVRDAAAAKGEEIGLGTKPLTREKRALGRALEVLSRPRDGLRDDLRVAVPVCRLLDGAFPGDPDLDPALGTCLGALRGEVLDARAALLAWSGRLHSDRAEERLLRGIQASDGSVTRSDGEEARAARARLLLAACRTLERTRSAVGIRPPRIDDPPFQGLAPDFSLPDDNPNSATWGLPVSPRDYPGLITAWYFVRTT